MKTSWPPRRWRSCPIGLRSPRSRCSIACEADGEGVLREREGPSELRAFVTVRSFHVGLLSSQRRCPRAGALEDVDRSCIRGGQVGLVAIHARGIAHFVRRADHERVAQEGHGPAKVAGLHLKSST